MSNTREAFCGYCGKRIYLARSGDWYHDHNSSTSCYFGTGSAKRAFPGGRVPRDANRYTRHAAEADRG